MTQKYIVATDIDGKIRLLSMISNLSAGEKLNELCASMLSDLFRGQKIDGFVMQPWPFGGEGA